MTGQQLKNSILQEAIKGRLVPNELQPGEKTGAELLQDILAERQKKENDEKGKKAKKLTLSTIEEGPWDLPNGCCWCKLGDIFEIYTGDSISESLKESKYKHVQIGYNYIGTKDVEFDHSVIYDNGVKIPYDEPKFKIAKSSAVLMCIEGGSAGKKIARITQDVCFGNKLCSFYCEEKTTNDYLYFYLQSANFRELFFNELNGLIGGVSIKKLMSLEFPLPPLSIQKAIVKKIEDLFLLVDEYEKASVELNTLNELLPDKLRKSILQEAIHGNLVSNDIPDGEATAPELLQQILKERQDRENKEKGRKAKKLSLAVVDDDLDELPGGWCWCKLSDIGDCLYGVSESAKTVGQYKLLRITDIQNDNVNWETVPLSDYKKKDVENYLLKTGDLVFARTGGTVGKSYLINVVPDNAIYASYLIRVRFHGKVLLPKYIKYFFQSPQYWSQIIESAEGTGQPNCNGTKLANLNIPLPPLSIQHRIVEKIEEVFAAIDKLQA